jgi:hypothetical protein
VIFVSDEPRIGKTTLTRAFADSLASDRAIRIAQGQCVDQYGAGEPYLPILEALTRLCREPGGEKLIKILHRVAPAWLAQMPSLVSAEDRARLQGLAQETTQQRMLREMAEALEVIAARNALVLYLEDLHWSDPLTLDLIATVARRSEPARLMILGTYRPVEMLLGKHPLRPIKEELELHQQAIELRLPLLSEADVAAFLVERFSDSKENIAPVVYARTEGNPLFMVIEYLADQGSLDDSEKIEAPRNIRQMIERNLQRFRPMTSTSWKPRVWRARSSRLRPSLLRCSNQLTRSRLVALLLPARTVGQPGHRDLADGTMAANIRFHHSFIAKLPPHTPATAEVAPRIAARGAGLWPADCRNRGRLASSPTRQAIDRSG